MFDLQHAIMEWRQQMAANDAATAEALAELESHLREEVLREVRLGVSEQLAFEAAVRRLGDAHVLKVEFEKIGETQAARARRFRACFAIGFASAYSLMVGALIVFKVGGLSDINLTQQIWGLAAAALTALLILSGHFGSRYFPVVPRKPMRVAIYSGGITLALGWLLVFYHLVMTRFELHPGPLAIAVLWALAPLAGLNGLIFALENRTDQELYRALDLGKN